MTVTNWAEYDAGLRRRGSLTLWVTDEAMAQWDASARSTPGGQPLYSNVAIETSLLLPAAFKLPLRQTEGLIGSVFQLLNVDLAVPDHSTVSRRAMTLPSISPGHLPDGPLHVLIDSMHGAGEWLTEKHGARARRSWSELHLTADANDNMIVASILTEKEVDDPSQFSHCWIKFQARLPKLPPMVPMTESRHIR